jgi:YD repeat-containing protein
MDVSPPVGPGWHFEWDALGTLSSITTPLGGSISYTYEDQSYSSFTMRVLSYRWMWPGAPFQGSPLAQWHFDLHPGYAANDPLADRTLITTPSHAVYRYEHFSGDPGPKTLGPGTGPLTQTIERESDAYWLDRVDTTYALAQFMGSPLNGGSALPIVVTTRHREFDSTAERATTSYISYPCTAHCYRVPYTITQTFSDAPTRITDRTFWGVPLGTPSLVIGMGRVKTETVTVNDEVVSYLERTYSHPTWLRYNTETVNGVTTTFTPQALGNVQTATTNGKTTTYTYEWGQVKTITGGEPNSEVNRSIRTDGRIESETVGGRTTHYDYDAIGRVTWIEPPGPSGGTVATTIDYTDPHHVVTARGSRSSTTDLDAFGNAIRTADDNTHVQTRMEYDPEGRVIYQSYPYTPGAASGGQDLGFHVEYDVLGRAFRTCQPDPDEGQSGDLCAQTTFSLGSTLSVDETGRSTRSFFTRHGVDELWDPLGHIWQYHYNAGDQLESITGPIGLPESATRTWSYDLATGRMLSETSPEAGTVTYQTEDAYNAAGQVEHKIDANGTDIRYTYDNNHRLATITASNASAGTSVQTVIGYESGASDLVHTTTATDSAQTGSIVTTIDYDEAGRPWRRTDAIDSKSFVTTFAYDELDNLKEIGYASGRHVRYVYDTAGRLTRVYNLETGQNYATNFVYHGSGALSGFTSGNGLVTTLEYEPKRYRLKTIDLNAGSLLHFEYAYYADGNVHELTEGTGTNAITRSFTYDDLDRLTSATASDPTKYPTTLYAFDAHGNRVQADSGQLPYHYYPAPNSFRLQSIGDLDPVHPTPFEYDNNGNLTTGPLTGGTGTFTYTYRPDNLMTRAVTSSGTSDFVYDGGGLRIKRVNGTGTAYFLKGPDSRLLSEWTPGSGTDVTAHDYIYAGGQLIGVATKTFQLGQ